MTNEQFLERITIDPGVCHGQPCVRGTRVLITVLLDALAAGMTPAQVVEHYPSITEEDVRAAAAYGAWLAKPEIHALSHGSRVKLDENVTAAAKSLFTAAGHQVDSVPDQGLTGVADDTVLAARVREGRWLVTFDVGFGDVRAHPPGQHPGIVLRRLRDQQPMATLDVVRRVLAEHDLESLAGSLPVVTDESVRIRRA